MAPDMRLEVPGVLEAVEGQQDRHTEDGAQTKDRRARQ
jgi:hypothetical protein